ncbi:MAG TPA: type II toxin-antitoxin system RelE/ParE family toxin [Prolixibacteraceae bacterium]|nr:type II toxin-antitoxin system RelE/ParE family toxin [Prolixibacteraceae bacterium]
MKKFPSLKKELQILISDLKMDPNKGTPIVHGCHKIRLAISSKGKGKSGGARVITHVIFQEDTVFLLSIYDKSEMENLTDNEIVELINQIEL